MKYVDCTSLSARETEERIWEYTDKNYQFVYESSSGNPTFIKYGNDGKVLDCVSFIHNYVDLSFCRKGWRAYLSGETGAGKE